MFTRTAKGVARGFLVYGLLAGLQTGMASADQIPAPKVELKDYDGQGVVQISTSPDKGAVRRQQDGTTVITPSFGTWFPFRQAYVKPDRVLHAMAPFNALQVSLALGDRDRQWFPAQGYIVERQFKNRDKAVGKELPSEALRMSMAAFREVVLSLDTAKLLPDEDLEALKPQLEARVKELDELRAQLRDRQKPEEEPQAFAAASEIARVRDDLDQLDLRKTHPCHLVEFANTDLYPKLAARGLTALPESEELLQGKTRLWVTKEHGFPIKLETTTANGHVAFLMIFKTLKINTGMHPGELTLDSPSGVPIIRLNVDLANPLWEERMERELNARLELLSNSQQGATPTPRGRTVPAQPRRR